MPSGIITIHDYLTPQSGYVGYWPQFLESDSCSTIEVNNSRIEKSGTLRKRQRFHKPEPILRKWQIKVIKPLEKIDEAIRDSEFIKTLDFGWDDEGAIPVPQEIYERAIRFLRLYATHIQYTYGVALSKPSISPLSDGSIDIYWKTPNASLLICIKNQKEEVAYYYGQITEGDKLGDANGEIPTDGTMDFISSGWFLNFVRNG